MDGGSIEFILFYGALGRSPIGKFVRSTKMGAQQWEGAPAPTPYRFFAP